MEGREGQDLQQAAGLGTLGAPFTCEGQKPFGDSIEMFTWHLGIVISEKRRELGAIPSEMSVLRHGTTSHWL